MSDIFKKITSIEPEDGDVLKALNLTPVEPDSSERSKPFTAVFDPEDTTDPVPDFITRETPPDTAPSPETNNPKTKTLEAELVAKQPSSTAPAEMAISAAALSQPEALQSYGWIKWAGIVAVLIWLGASFSYVYGFYDLGQKWTDMTPIALTGIIMAVLLPAILIILLFYALGQLSKVSQQSTSLSRTLNELTQPDETAITKTSIMSEAIKNEIDTVDTRIGQALARMATLEDTISKQNANLTQTSNAASQTSDDIASRLETQRLALENISGTFDERMALVSTTLNEYSTKLEASTQLAEQKIQEARISVEGAASGINSASELVRGNALTATTSLSQSHQEIESLASTIRERSAELDDVYRKHAQDLSVMIAQLRDEQQNMSISLEERLTKMRDMSLSAKVSAESLTVASEAGQSTVEALAQATRLTDTAVKQRFSEMEDLVRFSSEKADTISDQAARRVQDSLANTRKEIARIENDMAALQTRLSATGKPTSERELELDSPSQPKPKTHDPIRLKPLEEDFPPLEPPNLRDSGSALPFTSAPTLRAAPEKAERPNTAQNPPELYIPPTGQSLEQTITQEAPLELSAPMAEDLALEAEPMDLTELSPDQDLIDFDAQALLAKQESELVNPVSPKKTKSGWRWRDMLGGLDRPGTAKAENKGFVAQAQNREVSDQRMIASLTAIGLTPAAIIDDGCIIEATNILKSKGLMAMGQTVARRMGSPVRHLNRAMEENPALKTDARAYVTQFKARLGPIDNDREAIRTRLESDAGRAFLLCDAALNG